MGRSIIKATSSALFHLRKWKLGHGSGGSIYLQREIEGGGGSGAVKSLYFYHFISFNFLWKKIEYEVCLQDKTVLN